jgi:hypothetical protein
MAAPATMTESGAGHSPVAGTVRRLLHLAAVVFASSASIVVILAYIACAWNLVDYPWDWSPDEGLFLDFARRLLESPASLFHGRAVPFPSWFGPLYPALLAPFVHLANPLVAARILSLALTLLGALALAVLLRRRAGLLWALAGAALYLAFFDITSWYMLLRIDTPMVTLWLWSAVLLLPRDLGAGADRLSTGRIVGGTALLLAATLAKPTAAVHGLPLVLGWFLVDRRSAWRLTLIAAAGGLAIFGLLEGATKGGFLGAMLLLRSNGQASGLTTQILADFSGRTWPVLLMALVACLSCWKRRAHPEKEPAWLMLVGGLLVLPMTSKAGACWNYLLPLFAAIVAAAGSWAVRGLQASSGWRPAMAAGAAALALALAATRTFPLPTPFDEAAARTFYGFTQAFHRKMGGPLLVSAPSLVYFLSRQDTEIEGTIFAQMVAHDAPGTRDVLMRLEQARYTLVVVTWPLPAGPEWGAALQRNYRHLGVCRLGSYFTGYDSNLYARRDLPVDFTPPPGVRCAAVPYGR